MITYNIYLYSQNNFQLFQLCITLIPGFLFLVIAILSPKHIGLGDGIALLIVGGLFERQLSLYIIIGILLLNAIYCVIMLMIKKIKWSDKIPFFPFLSLSSISLLVYHLILDYSL